VAQFLDGISSAIALIYLKSAKPDLKTRHIPMLADTLRIFECALASERSDGSARIPWAYFENYSSSKSLSMQ
jgi:hypothetical protein